MINMLKVVKGKLKKINNANRKKYKENYYIENLLNKEISYNQRFKKKSLISIVKIDEIKRMRQIGEEYEKLLDNLLNLIFQKASNCLALELDDSLTPIFATTQVKTPNSLLAFPYKCNGKIGYIVVTEDGKLVFEDEEGNIIQIGDISI